jgi:hypothetical protein
VEAKIKITKILLIIKKIKINLRIISKVLTYQSINKIIILKIKTDNYNEHLVKHF